MYFTGVTLAKKEDRKIGLENSERTVSLIGRGIEQAGIATALVSVLEPLSSFARPPRQLIRKLNIGATVGPPGDIDSQLETLRRMIALIEGAETAGAVDRD